MSKVKTDELEGLERGDLVQIPVGLGDSVYVHNLFDKSYDSLNVITPTDIITKGPYVDPRAYGSNYNSTTLALAVVAINSMSPSNRTLIIPPGTWTITGALTFPSNICVYFLKGALFDVSGSVTFNGSILAGNYQIFTGAGTVTISTSTPLTYDAWDGGSSNFVEFKTYPRGPGTTPTAGAELVDKNYVDGVGAGAGAGGAPVGAIIDYAGSTAPAGWLLCDGSAVNRTTYSDLFSAIGTTYGSGDGSSTFNVPDTKGLVTMGYDATNSYCNVLGKTGGAYTVTLSNSQIPFGNSSGWLGYTSGYGGGQYQGASSHNNVQPYITLNKIIKY